MYGSTTFVHTASFENALVDYAEVYGTGTPEEEARASHLESIIEDAVGSYVERVLQICGAANGNYSPRRDGHIVLDSCSVTAGPLASILAFALPILKRITPPQNEEATEAERYAHLAATATIDAALIQVVACNVVGHLKGFGLLPMLAETDAGADLVTA